MIKADPGHAARYEATDENPRPRSRPIVAWDDDGHPLVVGSEGLIRADSTPGYEGIEPDADPLPFAFIPGNGWIVERENGSHDPLVAWAVCTYGGGSDVFAVPMFTEDVAVWQGNGRAWTSASMGGDQTPVRVVPDRPTHE